MPTDSRSGTRVEPAGEFIPHHKVTRDKDYKQFYADMALAVKAPRNLDLSFIRVQSSVTDAVVQEGRDLPDEFTFTPSVQEIGRVTIPVTIAFSLAMDILEEMSEIGTVNPDRLVSRIDAIIDRFRQSFIDRGSKSSDGGFG